MAILARKSMEKAPMERWIGFGHPRRGVLLSAALAIFWGAVASHAEYTPELDAREWLRASGLVGDWDTEGVYLAKSRPGVTAADWNGDGKKDLIVSYTSTYNYTKLRLFLNVGTDENPVFDNFTYIQANGSDLIIDPPGT